MDYSLPSGRLEMTVIEAKGLSVGEGASRSGRKYEVMALVQLLDYYGKTHRQSSLKTSSVPRTSSPSWHARLSFDIASHSCTGVLITVYRSGARMVPLGRVVLPPSSMLDDEHVSDWWPLAESVSRKKAVAANAPFRSSLVSPSVANVRSSFASASASNVRSSLASNASVAELSGGDGSAMIRLSYRFRSDRVAAVHDDVHSFVDVDSNERELGGGAGSGTGSGIGGGSGGGSGDGMSSVDRRAARRRLAKHFELGADEAVLSAHKCAYSSTRQRGTFILTDDHIYFVGVNLLGKDVSMSIALLDIESVETGKGQSRHRMPKPITVRTVAGNEYTFGAFSRRSPAYRALIAAHSQRRAQQEQLTDLRERRRIEYEIDRNRRRRRSLVAALETSFGKSKGFSVAAAAAAAATAKRQAAEAATDRNAGTTSSTTGSAATTSDDDDDGDDGDVLLLSDGSEARNGTATSGTTLSDDGDDDGTDFDASDDDDEFEADDDDDDNDDKENHDDADILAVSTRMLADTKSQADAEAMRARSRMARLKTLGRIYARKAKLDARRIVEFREALAEEAEARKQQSVAAFVAAKLPKRLYKMAVHALALLCTIVLLPGLGFTSAWRAISAALVGALLSALSTQSFWVIAEGVARHLLRRCLSAKSPEILVRSATTITTAPHESRPATATIAEVDSAPKYLPALELVVPFLIAPVLNVALFFLIAVVVPGFYITGLFTGWLPAPSVATLIYYGVKNVMIANAKANRKQARGKRTSKSTKSNVVAVEQ
jgi:GRAM domain/C2 domain